MSKRPLSRIAPGWWDYTTLDRDLLDAAAALTADDLLRLSRPGFTVRFYDTLEDFYLAEALEYITAWRQATPARPAGICGPIGPTEQLPLVARLVNELEIDLRHCHFWGMDEWVVDGQEAGMDFPLSFARADMDLCFNRIRPELRMPLENIHFPGYDAAAYIASWETARCVVMQGGQGEVKHWAFNDPPQRTGDMGRPAAAARGLPTAHDAGRRPAPDHTDPERAHVWRRRGTERAGAGHQRRAGGDMEGGKGVDLAGGAARQPVWHAADNLYDREGDCRQRGADVAAGRPSERAVQLLPAGDWRDGGGDALRRR